MTPSQADPSSRAEFKDRVLGGGRTCGGVVSYQRVFSALRSVVSSVDRISYHKGGKAKALLSLSHPLGCNSERTAGRKR